MVRFVCLKMHSGYIMRRDLKGKMLEAGRLVPFRAPPLWGMQRERTLHGDCSPVCILQKKSWKRRDSVSMLLRGCCPVQRWCGCFQDTEPQRASWVHKGHLGSRCASIPQISWRVSAEAAQKAASASCTLVWSSESLSGLALLPRPFVPALQTFNFRDRPLPGEQWGLRLSCSC